MLTEVFAPSLRRVLLAYAAILMVGIAILIVAQFARAQEPEIVRVLHPEVPVTGDTWDADFDDLQAALNSLDGSEGPVEIWVSNGTYYPTEVSDPQDVQNSEREISFELRSNVAIYGGFAGTESERNQRNWATNSTILSGDINQSGALDDNSYNVVYGEDVDETAVLDGVTVTGGNAEGPNFPPDDEGGGFHLRSASPILANLIVSGNRADFDGGAIYMRESSPLILNSLYTGNQSNSFGGGIMFHVQSSPTIVNTTIAGNRAQDGGGLYFSGSPAQLINSIIWGNESSTGDTQMRVGGVGIDNEFAPTLDRTIVEGGCNPLAICQQTWDDDPDFESPLPASQAPVNGGNYRLASDDSPAIDMGDNGAFTGVAGGLDRDLDFNQRISNDTIDLGPYEFQQEAEAPPLEIVRVNTANQNDVQDGASWDTAFSDLQDGLAFAELSTAEFPTVQIWVATGTYYPTDDGDRTVSFELRDNVEIYGGFVGTETEREQRDWAGNPTTLSGDIGAPGDNGDNSHTVVLGMDVDDSVILDGFTIRGGNANLFGSAEPHRLGGGIYLWASGSPILRHLDVTNNSANFGGGIFMRGDSPILEGIKIHDNQAHASGGGISLFAGSAFIARSIISGNQANDDAGGFESFAADATLINNTISGNRAGRDGGGISATGGSMTISNNTISGNRAGRDGGGLHSLSGEEVLQNTVLWGNHAGGVNHAINTAPVSDVSLLQSIVDENACGLSSVECTFMVDGPPLFIGWIDPSGAEWEPTSDGDYRLLPGSPAIDAGDNALYEDAFDNGILDVDLDGNPRIVPEDGAIDLGPYEAQFTDANLNLTAPETAAVNSSVDVSVTVTASGFDPALLNGVVVTLTGHNGPTSIELDATGEGAAQIPVGVAAGPLELTAALGTLTDTETITVLPGSAASFELDVQPNEQSVGQPVTVAISNVIDEHGNTVSNDTEVTIEVSRPDTAGLVNGNGLYPWVIETTDGTASLQYTNTLVGVDDVSATVDDVTETLIDAVTWLPGAPDSISLEADSSQRTVGEPVTLTASGIEDALGNTVEDGSLVTFNIDGPDTGDPIRTDGGSGLTAETVDGVATLSYTKLLPGLDTVTASAGNDPVVTSNPVTVEWLLPVSTTGVSVTASGGFFSGFSASAAASARGGPAGSVSFNRDGHSFSTRSIDAVAIDGNHAVIFTQVSIGGETRFVRVDLRADANTAQVRWPGYDSGEFGAGTVRIR